MVQALLLPFLAQLYMGNSRARIGKKEKNMEKMEPNDHEQNYDSFCAMNRHAFIMHEHT